MIPEGDTPARIVRIDRTEFRLIRLPLVHFFETSFGRIGSRAFTLVRVEDGGTVGHGGRVASSVGDDNHRPMNRRTHRKRVYAGWWGAMLAAAVAGGCATVPEPVAPVVTRAQKMGWILRLEDQRLLRDPVPPPAVEPVSIRRGQAVPPPAILPDLVALLDDADARIRRRAMLAVGRVGSPDGVLPLMAKVADPEPQVREMAAFSLGLLGDRRAIEPLVALLQDVSPLVQGRAADALGRIGDATTADAIGRLVASHVDAAAAVSPDALDFPMEPEIEAFRLGVYALGRLKAYDALASAVLDGQGRPRVGWWPVAYALQQTEDVRSGPALFAFLEGNGRYAASFAARGLGAVKVDGAVDALLRRLEAMRADPILAVSLVRALAQIGDPRAGDPLLAIVRDVRTVDTLRLEAVTALGTLRHGPALDVFLDMVGARWSTMRAAALRAIARIDPTTLVTVLSGLDPDPEWSVRAAVASALALAPPEVAKARLSELAGDPDQRVVPAVLTALRELNPADLTDTLVAHLAKPDVVVRMTAARHLGELHPPQALPALLEAWRVAGGDSSYVARGAILTALAQYRVPEAIEVVRGALSDREWAIRVRAAALLDELEAGTAHAAGIAPVPSPRMAGRYDEAELIDPQVSPHVFIDTTKGTIQIELAVLDAPLTSATFMELARSGFYNGLQVHRVVPNFVVQYGDPRGDSEGGPGYAIRDELSPLPYLRGTVGMALDWRDTGGSQFFITLSPQPQLDGRYPVFGRVIAGIEVVDRLQQWDVVERVRVWDGVQMTGGTQ